MPRKESKGNERGKWKGKEGKEMTRKKARQCKETQGKNLKY